MLENVKVGDVLVVRLHSVGRDSYRIVRVSRVTKTAIFTLDKGDDIETRWDRISGFLYGSKGSPWGRSRLTDEPAMIKRAHRWVKESTFIRACEYCVTHAGLLTDQEIDDVAEPLEALRVRISRRRDQEEAKGK